ncbi:MAG: hypothetical protein HYZ74_07955 [Elusimicrobia bacterium]|nr:hypothetical protein [Elusimicrobiota bacterium]
MSGVAEAIRASFPPDRWEPVARLLNAYGAEPHERERERVQLAVLTLSAGNEKKLREFVAIAKADYRDVLFWAEHSREATADAAEKKKEVLKMLDRFGLKPPTRPGEQ